MIEVIAKYVVLLFGFFLVFSGLFTFFKSENVREIIGKACSTNFINYTEISIRMIPDAAMFIYAEYSKFPEIFKIFGAFMLITSIVLYFVPRRFHHNFAFRASEELKPLYVQLIAPLSMLFGCVVIYSVI